MLVLVTISGEEPYHGCTDIKPLLLLLLLLLLLQELMGWHPCGVKGPKFELSGYILVTFWSRKRNLVQVSGEFEFSEFQLTR